MVITRSRENATGQPGCQEYLTCERCRIREILAVNASGRSCSRRGAADGGLADVGCLCELAERAGEPAGRCGDEAGACPPQPVPASDSTAASTAGTTTWRILVMPAQPTHPARPGLRRADGGGDVPGIIPTRPATGADNTALAGY